MNFLDNSSYNMEHQDTDVRFAICIDDGGYVDDLKVRTVYQVLPDGSAAKSHYLRIVDETGEDYLYPASYFVLIDIPREVEQIFTLSTLPAERNREEKKARKKSGSKRNIPV